MISSIHNLRGIIMYKCYLCENEIKKEHPEHIIPNAIGGKLKNRFILCSSCNNKLGSVLDNAFQDLAPLTNMLNPKRDSGSAPTINVEINGIKGRRTAEGELYARNIQVDKNSSGDKGFKIQFKMLHGAGTVSEKLNLKKVEEVVRQLMSNSSEDKIQKQLLSIKSKIETESQNVMPLVHQELTINSNGNLFAAILKIAVNFYFYNKLSDDNLDAKYMLDSIKILKSTNFKMADTISFPFYNREFINPSSVCHTIILKGDKKEKLLYCLVSIYGSVNFIVIFNEDYTGKDILKSYEYDLRNSEEKQCNFIPEIKKNELVELKNINHEKWRNSIKDGFAFFLDFFVRHPTENMTEIIIDLSKRIFSNSIAEYKNINRNNYEKWFIDSISNEIYKFKELKILKKQDIINLVRTLTTYLYSYDNFMSEVILNEISNIVKSAIENNLQVKIDSMVIKSNILQDLSNIKFVDDELDALFQSKKLEIYNIVENLVSQNLMKN